MMQLKMEIKFKLNLQEDIMWAYSILIMLYIQLMHRLMSSLVFTDVLFCNINLSIHQNHGYFRT